MAEKLSVNEGELHPTSEALALSALSAIKSQRTRAPES